jgi:hypothetical protein
LGFSTTSHISEHSGIVSPRSLISSEHHPYHHSPKTKEPPSTPDKTADLTPRATVNGPSTDPVIIHAITQTMIGEFLYKYTIGKGVGEKRHKLFLWVHRYTKTLYWSSADPGSWNVSESSAKSGMFISFIWVTFHRLIYWFLQHTLRELVQCSIVTQCRLVFINTVLSSLRHNAK